MVGVPVDSAGDDAVLDHTAFLAPDKWAGGYAVEVAVVVVWVDGAVWSQVSPPGPVGGVR